MTASRSQRKPLQSSSLNNGTIHFHPQKLLKKMLRGKNLSLCKHFFNLTSFMKYKENKRGFGMTKLLCDHHFLPEPNFLHIHGIE